MTLSLGGQRATTPAELTASLKTAHTELTHSGDALYIVCTPSDTKLQLRLVESGSAWLVNGLLTSQVRTSGGNATTVAPCRTN